MLRLLLFVVLAYVAARVLWRLLRGVFEGMGYRPADGSPQSVGLVRDPVCGTFLMPSKAVISGSGSNTRYFCSDKCRRDYAAAGDTRPGVEEARKRPGPTGAR